MDFNSPNNKPNSGSNWKAKNKYGKGKYRPQPSADIVYVKGTSFQTVPPLSKVLDGIPVLGLQYVWEYRSPSKTVPPHYECKLCRVPRSQHDMIAHVKGWKHNYIYMKKAHPDKVHWEEEDAVKDPAVRKMIKDSLAEVEQLGGRGQVKVIMKEPYKVPAFKGLRSAQPKPLPATSMGPNGPPFGPIFSDQSRHEEFPPDEGPYDEFSGDYQDEFEPPNFKRFASERRFSDSNPDKYQDEYESSNFECFSPKQHFSDADMSPRPYPHEPEDDFSQNNGRDRFGSGRMFPDQYQGPQMGGSLMDIPTKKPFDRPRPMKAPSDGGCDSDSLLHYLETFRIENESDAQLVLKVTQKLTELLMEYRLKTIAPEGHSLSSSSLNSSFLSSPSSSLARSSDRYSRALAKGQYRFLDGPLRF
ncbi:uncharacterized protein si:ch211-197h24.6 [Phycodurus eques]|uniref:uncharacterized protein si:ch211-197h24.6 n=1 Tax=Phycodurus eques TaxID=693459 RepID=UPI002ACEB218|nr:uncharacterized protein si:ch211-197h24.6 [Phycodurus eques]